jgi:hypothetical protein
MSTEDWSDLSQNPLAKHILADNPHKVDKKLLCRQPFCVELVRKDPSLADWNELSRHEFALELLLENEDKIDPEFLDDNKSKDPRLAPIAIRFKDEIEILNMVYNDLSLAEKFFNEYPRYLDKVVGDVPDLHYQLVMKHINELTTVSPGTFAPKYIFDFLENHLGICQMGFVSGATDAAQFLCNYPEEVDDILITYNISEDPIMYEVLKYHIECIDKYRINCQNFRFFEENIEYLETKSDPLFMINNPLIVKLVEKGVKINDETYSYVINFLSAYEVDWVRTDVKMRLLAERITVG